MGPPRLRRMLPTGNRTRDPEAPDQGAVVVVTGAEVVGGVTAGWTVIVCCTWALPWPRAVSVYTWADEQLANGTWRDPLGPKEPKTPGPSMLMLTPVALVVVQLRVTWPLSPLPLQGNGLGVAVNEVITGAPGWVVGGTVVEVDVVLVEEEVLVLVGVTVVEVAGVVPPPPPPDTSRATTTPITMTPTTARAIQSQRRSSEPPDPGPCGTTGSSGGPTGGIAMVGS